MIWKAVLNIDNFTVLSYQWYRTSILSNEYNQSSRMNAIWWAIKVQHREEKQTLAESPMKNSNLPHVRTFANAWYLGSVSPPPPCSNRGSTSRVKKYL